MKSGVYKIINIRNNKIYIGSAKNISKRFSDHLSRLRHNKHNNKLLQKEFNEYGESKFLFEVVEKCVEKDIFVKEQYYLDTLQPFGDKGYNILYKVDGWSGYKHNEDMKKYMSEKMKGEGNPMFGKHLSDETKRKMSQNMKGEKNPFFGRQHSQEIKEKIKQYRIKTKMSKGSRNSNAKLNEEEVYMIRKWFVNNEINRSGLARMFDVSWSQIDSIVKNKSWK